MVSKSNPHIICRWNFSFNFWSARKSLNSLIEVLKDYGSFESWVLWPPFWAAVVLMVYSLLQTIKPVPFVWCVFQVLKVKWSSGKYIHCSSFSFLLIYLLINFGSTTMVKVLDLFLLNQSTKKREKWNDLADLSLRSSQLLFWNWCSIC